MTRACPIDLDQDLLRARVVETYARLARDPGDAFHFHRGPKYAVEWLGYDAAEIAALPPRAADRFAGVGNPLALGALRRGAWVLDHACGAGLDLLLAARRVGAFGRAIGVDVTPAMRGQANLAATEAGLAAAVEIRAGSMEELPVPDASIDVVISNGVVNLSPDKPRVFAEIARVLRPGGRLLLADVVVAHALRPQTRADAELWAACIAGAAQPSELVAMAREAGLDVSPDRVWWDCFAGAPVASRVAASLELRALGLNAIRR